MLSHVRFFVTLWAAVCQAPLSIKHHCPPAISINMTKPEWLSVVSGIPVNHAPRCLHPMRDHPHWGWAGPQGQLWPTGHLGRVMQWTRHLRVPWTARRSNQSILKEISPEYSLQGLTLKLRLQCFGHLMQRADSLEKTLTLRKTEGKRRRGSRGWDGWMASLMQWTWVWASSGSWWRSGKPGVLQSTGSQRVGHDWATEQQGT